MTCESCGKSTDYKKIYGVDFPEQIESTCLEKNSKKTKCILKRDYGSTVPIIDVAEGSVGNAKNGYTQTTGSYIPGRFAPLKPRMSMFNDDGTVTGGK